MGSSETVLRKVLASYFVSRCWPEGSKGCIHVRVYASLALPYGRGHEFWLLTLLSLNDESKGGGFSHLGYGIGILRKPYVVSVRGMGSLVTTSCWIRTPRFTA